MSGGTYSTYTNYIVLNPAYTTATITNTGTVYESLGNAVAGGTSNAYTLFNFGQIHASNGDGVYLQDGGSVINGSASDKTAQISGRYTGISIVGSGTVTNYGTVQSQFTGIDQFLEYRMSGAGRVNNDGTAALIYGVEIGVSIAGGTVSNEGTIAGNVSDEGIAGIVIYSSANIANLGATSLIKGSCGILCSGVSSGNSPSTLSNAGTVYGGTGDGVYFFLGGSVTNGASGLIESADARGVWMNRTGTVSNAGTIEGTNDIGVFLQVGGTVTNHGTGALIEGETGVRGSAASTIINYGTIEGTSGTAVILPSVNGVLEVEHGSKIVGKAIGVGGTLVFGSAGGAGTASGFDGVTYTGFGTYEVATGAHWTLGGTIITGTELVNDGTLTARSLVVSGSIDTIGSLSGGVTLTGGYLTNAGTATATGNAVYGAYGYTASVTDLGRIVASGANGIGVYLAGGGTVTVGSPTNSTALLRGTQYGAKAAINPVAVTAYGTIQGSNGAGAGVYLGDGGGVTIGSAGLIEGHVGVAIEDATGTVLDLGVIQGVGGFGLYLANGGNATVGSTSDHAALIEGTTGIALNGMGTITDFGTIDGSGGTAIQFGTSSDLLVLEAGAAFAGTVSGAGGTLELGTAGGAGTLSGLGTSLANFGTILVDPGAAWTLAGASSIAAGSSLINDGVLATGGNLTLASGGYLLNDGLITAATTAVRVNSGVATLVNAGTIDGTGTHGIGVQLTTGDVVTNAAAGLIEGGYDAVTLASAGTLVNDGVILGIGSSSAGVDLGSGGYVSNAATARIEGYYGILAAGGTIANLGTVIGTATSGAGLTLDAAFASNGASGSSAALIEGYVGARLNGGLLVDYGTIEGTGVYAVEFASGTPSVLVLETGAAFIGTVLGTGGVLELASNAGAGTLSGLGTEYVGFASIQVESGAAWTFAGSNDVSDMTALVDSGVLTIAGTLSVEGVAAITATGTLHDNGTILVDGGTFVDSGVLSGAGTIEISSGTVELPGLFSGTAIDFTGHGLLALGSTNGVTVENFTAGDTIDLAGISYSAQDTVTYDSGLHEIIVHGASNAVLATIDVTGLSIPAGDTLSLKPDGGGTDVVVCFAAGTRILTEQGEIPVETLVPSQRVVTLSGRGPVFKPVKWLGRRRLDAARHPTPDEIYPIRIKADAFADGVPHRDLLVSPGHAICVDGVLIPAERLVNGVTITRDRSVSSVEYLHVELEEHDLLLAEGLPAESYYDSGNRRFFENTGGPVELHAGPDDKNLPTTSRFRMTNAGNGVSEERRRAVEHAARREATPTRIGAARPGDENVPRVISADR